MQSRWMARVTKIVIGLASGATLLGAGTSCGEDIRISLQAAGADFIKSSASQALQQLFPIKDMLANWQQQS